MSNVIDILIQSRNTSGGSVAAAEAQLRGLQATATRMGGALAQATGNLAPMSSGMRGIAEAAGPVGLALGAVAAAAIGAGTAIYKSAAALTDQVEQLQRVSNQTGVSTQNLQVLQRITQESGGDVGSLTQAFSFLNRAIAENNPMLKSLGITTRDTFTAFMQLARILAQSTDTANATKVAMELLGRGGKEMLGTVSELVRKFPEMSSELQSLGLVMSEDTVEAIGKLDSKLEAAQRRWDSFKQSLTIATAPVAGAIADFIANGQGIYSADALNRVSADTSGARIPFPNVSEFARAAELAFSGQAVAAKQSADSMLAVATNAKMSADEQAKAADAAKKHAETVRQIALAMSATTAEAENMLGVYELVEKNRALDKLREKIVAAQEAAKSLNTLIADALGKEPSLPQLRVTGPRGQFKPTEAVKAPSAEDVEKLRALTGPEQMRATFDQWRDFTDQVFTGAQMLNSGLTAVQQGLTTGFQTAFASMLSGAMSFAQAMRSIFTSLVNAIIAELARLAAYAVVKGLLNLVTGGVAGAATGAAGEVGGAMAATSSAGGAAMASRVTTININALDARSILQQTVSPSGALRMTNLRMAELAAVS